MEAPLGQSRRTRFVLYAATVVVALIGMACLGSNRGSLSGTFDESNHLAAGLEWWQFGTYTMWTENPPLARLAIAALPFLAGMRLPPREQWEPKTHEWDRSWEVGTDLLYGGRHGRARLTFSRLASLEPSACASTACRALKAWCQARKPPAGSPSAKTTTAIATFSPC
jgi:hypothetical protein